MGYYYRAVDKYGAIVDFYLSETHDEPAARAFFDKALDSSGLPSKVVIDKSGVLRRLIPSMFSFDCQGICFV